MTQSKGSKAAKAVTVDALAGEGQAEAMARAMTIPYLRHGIVTQGIVKKMVGDLPGEPDMANFGKAIRDEAERARNGDLTLASELLTAQALSLDSMFTEYVRRATMNMGDYPLAMERFAKLAMRAQANCRASLEALAKLHQPREQTVRHVHVNEGGQAVIADHIHHHGGSGENGKSVEQSHAPGAADHIPPMLGADPDGCGVPIPSGQGQAAVQNARGD